MSVLSAATLLLATAVVAAPGDNAVGVNVHQASAEHVAAASALGVSWVRVDGNWFEMQPARTSFSFAPMDAQVARVNAAGLSVFMTLAYTPSWVARRGDTDGWHGNDIPNASTEWSAFVREVVLRYRPMGVRHFGLWNEANLRQFWEGSLQEYATIIANPGAAAVRAACGDCLVLGPDLANVGASDDALAAVLAATPGTWDIVTHHIYQGFRETGTQIWDGDSFINVLDQQRFTFTRRSLRQLLDAAGWSGEVWITETGYRATPGDSAREATQATYVRRVLEEQLARAWYTNTFFYEISDCGPDQPQCPIDGFGLMRATAGQPGSRRFPQDFRLKPAFTAIQGFIAANPQIVGAVPPPQCSDGIDNDGDGRIDMNDRGCESPGDDDESDPPPRSSLVARRTASVALDADLGEYAGAAWLMLAPESWRGVEPLTAGDLEVRAAAAWTPEALYLAFEVEDDIHDNAHPPENIWQGDSVQLGFDVGQDSGDGYDNRDDHELNFALDHGTGAAKTFRFHGPPGASADFALAAARRGTRTIYEIRLGATALGVTSLASGRVVGFSFLVNDADGAGRVGWKEWTRGIGTEKAPYWFGQIELMDALPTSDAGVLADASGVDAATAPDVGAPEAGLADGGVSGPDAEEPTREDAGATPVADAAASEGRDAGESAASTSGCGCNATPEAPGGPVPFACALLLAIASRRRRR